MTQSSPTLILVPGLWLAGSVWDDTVAELGAQGHRALAVTLPGAGAPPAAATLDDQLAAVLAAADSAEAPVLVGHSAACSLVWLAADRRPDLVRRVVMIGGFPTPDGRPYADFFEIVDGTMPFPGWEPFAGPDSDDLDEPTRQRVADEAIPVPEAVAQAAVRLGDERRFDVPVTVVCPEFSPAQAQAWIAAGEIPELASVRDLTFVDIDSGHWPMISRPHELAAILSDTAQQR